MSFSESIDEEVKEFLRNYKQKKATTYEPCTLENFRECLIGLSEELSILNINYIFNPYTDVTDDTLQAEALVRLVNAVWVLLHHHKSMRDKADGLAERNHFLENTVKQLNVTVDRLKVKASSEKNEARACVASAQRISNHSDEIVKALNDARLKLTQLTKQKENKEKALNNEIARLKLQNEKLTDKLRNKADYHAPCSEVCDSTIIQLKERDQKQRAMIGQLQVNNQKLLREVIALKEEILLSDFQDINVGKGKK